MNKCMNCGFEDESAIFCQNCGQQMTPLLSGNNAYTAYPQQPYAQPEQGYGEVAIPDAQYTLMNSPQAMPPQPMTEQERMQLMLRQQQDMINRQQMMMQQMQQSQPSQPVVVNVQQSVEQSVEQNVGVTVQVSESTDPWFFWLEILAIGGVAWFIAGAWWIGLITLIVLIILLQIPVLNTAICWVLGAGVGLLAGAVSHSFDAPTWACWLIGIVVGLGCAYYNTEACEQELAD